MGVALVNLVWRRLAVVPAVFQWSWWTLKPHYQIGTIPDAAWMLRERLELPALGSIDANDFTELAGLEDELLRANIIDDVLRTYERGNAQNLIALCYLQLCLDSSVHRWENAGSDGVELNATQSTGQRADANFGAIPELPRLDSLPEEMQMLVARTSAHWVPSEYSGLTPSVFRHLSHWPDLLRLFNNRLEAVERNSDQNIQPTADKALDLAQRCAWQLGENGKDGEVMQELNQTDRQWLQEVLDVFIHGMLARGVVIVPALRSLLTSDKNS